MKRTRAQQPKAEEPQDTSAAAAAPANPSPKPQQRRAKQPRQPKAGARARPAAANAAPSSPGPETAPAVPDACDAGERAVDCWDLDAGLSAAAWWTWGVDEEKLLGWFPFVEEDFRCAGGGAAEVAAFDHDIWSIW